MKLHLITIMLSIHSQGVLPVGNGLHSADRCGEEGNSQYGHGHCFAVLHDDACRHAELL